MDIIQALEHDTGKLVVSSLSSLIWEVLHKLGTGESIPSHGELLGSMGARR
jgi:maleate cis-trans isomerase